VINHKMYLEETMKTFMFVLFFILLSSFLYSTTRNVPGTYSTIQAGIDASVNGDVVLVQPGTYVENISFNGKLITVGSLYFTTADTSYISTTTIDGNSDDAVVYIYSGVDSTAVLTGFTITNGYASYGGGIHCSSSTPIFEHLIITNNWANYGGGIYCSSSSSPIIRNVTITENTGAIAGGGIYCNDHSIPILGDVTVMFNSANYGGGVYCNPDCNATFENSFIIWNGATNWGGGMCFFQSNPNLYDVVIFGNIASDGGGIYCNDHSSPILDVVTIEDNTVTGNGGGIYCENYSSPTLTNVTIEDNSSDNGGGIYCLGSSSPSLDYVTISGNTAIDGGGMYCDSASPNLENVTLSINYANKGGGLYCYNFSSPILDNATIEENVVSTDGGGIFCDQSSCPELFKVEILHNSANYFGGGIWSTNDSDISLDHVTIAGNLSSGGGGGAYIWYSSPIFEHVTITDNISIQGGGIFLGYSGSMLTNSIIWGNANEEIYMTESTMLTSYSDVEGGVPGSGNFYIDPLFTDPGNDHYTLHYASPCIDSGNPTSPLDPDGTRADMGAHFFDQSINGEPTITAITDVPYDQGRNVQVVWDKSPFDIPGSSVPLESYSVWRLDDLFDTRETVEIYDNPFDIFMKTANNSDRKYCWQRDNEILTFITQVPAVTFDQYAIIAPTLLDSSTVSMNYSTFKIMAQTEVSSLYYFSQPDSGYSVDNIAPDETVVIVTNNGNNMNLNWDEVEYGSFQGNSYPEVNGIWYKIYAGESPDFICDQIHLINTVSNLNYNYPIGGEEKKFFKIVVSDQP